MQDEKLTEVAGEPVNPQLRTVHSYPPHELFEQENLITEGWCETFRNVPLVVGCAIDGALYPPRILDFVAGYQIDLKPLKLETDVGMLRVSLSPPSFRHLPPYPEPQLLKPLP
ncbi:MAG: hypothetical protein QXH26_01365 [Candidatus Hadarchaeales archaeon]